MKMAKIHVRKDDNVVVLTGKDAGKKGKVLEVLPVKRKVLVDGVNVAKRHMKPRPPRFPQGGRIEKAMPLDASNVQLLCPRCNKATRIAKKLSQEGGKSNFVRVCKRCGEEI